MVDIGNNCNIAAIVLLIVEIGALLSDLKSNPYIKDPYMNRGKITIEDHARNGVNAIIFLGVNTRGVRSIVDKIIFNVVSKNNPMQGKYIRKNKNHQSIY